MYVCLCLCLYMYMFIFVNVYVCMSMCVCVCVDFIHINFDSIVLRGVCKKKIGGGREWQLDCLALGCDILVTDRPDVLHSTLDTWHGRTENKGPKEE